MSLLTDGAKGGSAAWKKTKLRTETLFNTWATTVNAGQAATGCREVGCAGRHRLDFYMCVPKGASRKRGGG